MAGEKLYLCKNLDDVRKGIKERWIPVPLNEDDAVTIVQNLKRVRSPESTAAPIAQKKTQVFLSAILAKVKNPEIVLCADDDSNTLGMTIGKWQVQCAQAGHMVNVVKNPKVKEAVNEEQKQAQTVLNLQDALATINF
jgi:hypothetical protein